LRRERTADDAGNVGSSVSPTASRDDHHDTVVPLEGRILRDTTGQVIFIGDCAPLSFLQTVRHLIASEVDTESLAVSATRDPIIEIARPEPAVAQGSVEVNPQDIQSIVHQYCLATAGLVDLFQVDLVDDVTRWSETIQLQTVDTADAVRFLVLAIGAQESNESKAEAWFTHARDILLRHLCSSMNISLVQGFTLLAIFMLRASQPNGAYLYFGMSFVFLNKILYSNSLFQHWLPALHMQPVSTELRSTLRLAKQQK
jgi:hypothetical protein